MTRETNMTSQSLQQNQIIWPLILAIASVCGSYTLACVFPFAAIAALAALNMEKRAAIMMVIAAWAANQFVGFFLLSFPWDAQAVGHGIAILAATLAAYGTARFVAGRMGTSLILRSVAALASAFCVYEVILAAYAQVGGGAENFTAEIVSGIALNDSLWFVGLMAIRIMLARVTGEKLAIRSA